MINKTRLFFVVFFILFFAIAGISFVRYFVLKDYFVQTELECDPAVESCFVYTCDPIDDTECPEAVEERTSYYKLIQKKAAAMPNCDPSDAKCPTLECGEGENCKVILCDQGVEECMYPEVYLKNLSE